MSIGKVSAVSKSGRLNDYKTSNRHTQSNTSLSGYENKDTFNNDNDNTRRRSEDTFESVLKKKLEEKS